MRSANDLLAIVKKRLVTKYIMNIASQSDLDVYLNNVDEKPHVLLFTNKIEPTILYKSISMQFQPYIDFAEINNQNNDIVELYNIKDFPTLLLIQVSNPS